MQLTCVIKRWIDENKDKDSFVDDVWKGYNYLSKFQNTKEYKEKVSDRITCVYEDCNRRFLYSKAEHNYEEETLKEHYLDPASKTFKTFNVTYSTNYVTCPYCKRKMPYGTKRVKEELVEEEDI